MSVKWYKFQLRPDVRPSEVQDLLAQQSDNFRAAFNWPRPGQDITDAQRQVSAQKYLAASNALVSRAYFHRDGENFATHDSGAIMYNSLLPIEWREASKASILPADLPARLDQWKAYAQDVRLGYYEDYLQHLFLFEDYNPHDYGYAAFKQLQSLLSTKALALPASGEDFTETESFRKLIAELKEAPFTPLPITAPVFSPEARERDLQPETKALFATYKKETERLMHQVIAWNRVVPEAHKLRIPTFIPVQVRMHQSQTAAREFLARFFVWCDTAVQEGMGLFLAT